METFDWGAFLYNWQTMITGGVATLAALLTIGVMQAQRGDETKRHAEAERRKRMAARASMPDALSDLSAYIRGCGVRLVGQADALPPQPIEAIATLKSVIEHIDDGAATRTFQLVSWYQVFRARMSADIPDPGAEPYFGERVYDASLLQAYLDSLFGYARNEEEDVDIGRPLRRDMENALKGVVGLTFFAGHGELFEGALATIIRRHPVV